MKNLKKIFSPLDLLEKGSDREENTKLTFES